MPFEVVVKGQTINDIGTHFNINAYNDEPDVKTTLIEGSISVANKTQKYILIPGDQAVTKNNQQIEIIKNANVGKSIAWKNGFFNFEDADLGEVMRQISRWYDVEITYEGEIPKREFTGKIYRSTNASKVLSMLNYTRIHFRIENSKFGKKIIVTP
jgi:ferric-dicitrate binding protein FerR (iron transport regulator)